LSTPIIPDSPSQPPRPKGRTLTHHVRGGRYWTRKDPSGGQYCKQFCIQRYKLADTVVYDSKNRQQYSEAAKGHLESTRDQASLLDSPKNQLVGAAKTFYRLGRASFSTALGALSLRITVSSLLRGVHIECKSMGELLEGEDAIVTAARNVKQYLETAATFDGREEILEF
jgi:hypothetical protein